MLEICTSEKVCDPDPKEGADGHCTELKENVSDRQDGSVEVDPVAEDDEVRGRGHAGVHLVEDADALDYLAGFADGA